MAKNQNTWHYQFNITPYIPAQIQAVRSTLGPKEMDATNCYLCGKNKEDIKHGSFSIISKMEGDFEGTPIDSEAVRALFCLDCFCACAGDELVSFFEKYQNCGIIERSDCFYCKKVVLRNDLIKYFKINNVSIPRNTNRVTCVIHEECYAKNIGV